MSRVIQTLNQLESRLQSLVEGSTAKLFPRSATSHQLAALLEEAIQQGLHDGPNGELVAPNLFYLSFHPDQAAILQKDGVWIEQLARTLLELEEYSNFKFSEAPVVRVVGSVELEYGEMKVLAEFNSETSSETAGKPVDQKVDEDDSSLQGYLIVNGTRVFLLDQIVMNIGRRSDNQLVLEDGKVSRLHAQIRVIDHNYVIFDLDSARGTWVNGEKIHQRRLMPGDVISIAGIPLVFGQETHEHGETTEYRPPAQDSAGKA